eukprot:TRINITY_DN158_c0_g1_i2.p1 TRINITY_DN158_c0_g1~~TRINITY_DN158_c0_g1_i2.p1  ORF type:complete len:614 (-),score=176.86 TRINITY_DN158_c0_g1_i2:1579-3375(-)
MQEFHEATFLRQLNTALVRVRTILDNTRDPQYAANVSHNYQDKYLLAEFLTNTALAGTLNGLQLIGLNDSNLILFRKWAHTRTVTLSLKSEEACSFEREATRSVESPVSRTTTVFGVSVTDKVVTKITEYFWKFVVKYEIHAYPGNNKTEGVTLQTRTCEYEIVTTSKTTPRPETKITVPINTEIGWLLRNVHDDGRLKFKINRENPKTCHTPRRNDDVEDALAQFQQLHGWCEHVNRYFRSLFSVENHHFDLQSLSSDEVFVPVLPIMLKPQGRPQTSSLVEEFSQELTTPTEPLVITDRTQEPESDHSKIKDVSATSEKEKEIVSPRKKDKKRDKDEALSPRKKKEREEKKLKSKSKSKSKIIEATPTATTTTTTTTTTTAPTTTANSTGVGTGAWNKQLTINLETTHNQEDTRVFSVGEANLLLDEQKRNLKQKLEEVASVYPPSSFAKLLSVHEAVICVASHHLQLIAKRYHEGVSSLEDMLRKQLVAAIGREVSVKDLSNYMKFHNHKLFKAQYAPKPFSYAIRRPEHYPEGLLVLEHSFTDGTVSEPVHTICQHLTPHHTTIPPLKLPINASTNCKQSVNLTFWSKKKNQYF